MVSRGIGQRSCSMGSQMMGDTVEQVSADMDTIMIRQPLGVCAGSPPPPTSARLSAAQRLHGNMLCHTPATQYCSSGLKTPWPPQASCRSTSRR